MYSRVQTRLVCIQPRFRPGFFIKPLKVNKILDLYVSIVETWTYIWFESNWHPQLSRTLFN